jgi:hypothetical protein
MQFINLQKMKNKSLKLNDNIDQKKYRKNLVKYNTEYNKNKNTVSSIISKKNIISKHKEDKSELLKNKSNKNITNAIQNTRMKKTLTSINDKLNSGNPVKNKVNTISNKNESNKKRKSIKLNKNINISNNNKNITKQLYINEIIPNANNNTNNNNNNHNKIFFNHVKYSLLRANNYNTYHNHKSPKQNNKECNISINSHSQKNKNHRKIINSNLNEQKLKLMKKNNTELNHNYNTINYNYNRSSSKSNKNIQNINNFKSKNSLSSSADKEKNFSSSLIRTTLNNSMNHRTPVLASKIVNNNIYKNTNMFELNYELEKNISEINYTISNLNSNDFALCNSNSSLDVIYDKLIILCKEKGLTLAKIESNKFICKKDGDNSIKIEINRRGKTNVLKIYYLNGKESITKEIIKEIILRIGF